MATFLKSKQTKNCVNIPTHLESSGLDRSYGKIPIFEFHDQVTMLLNTLNQTKEDVGAAAELTVKNIENILK